MRRLLKLFVCVGVISYSYADSQVLNKFLSDAKTMSASFTQSIQTGKKVRTTTGTLLIARPNKFRWEYTQDQQFIISDGKKIYIYDKPLAQVTVKPLGKSLDKSPAALLAGANDIQRLYKVTELADKTDDLQWIKVEPKQKNDNNGFQQVLMGFNQQNQLIAMRFVDNFGYQSSLKFSNLHTGMAIADKEFKFVTPKGVDVAE